jgi:hypothetical protein
MARSPEAWANFKVDEAQTAHFQIFTQHRTPQALCQR